MDDAGSGTAGGFEGGYDFDTSAGMSEGPAAYGYSPYSWPLNPQFDANWSPSSRNPRDPANYSNYYGGPLYDTAPMMYARTGDTMTEAQARYYDMLRGQEATAAQWGGRWRRPGDSGDYGPPPGPPAAGGPRPSHPGFGRGRGLDPRVMASFMQRK